MGIRELRARHDECFREFFDAFPRKVDHLRAFDEFINLVENGVDPQMLIEKARAYSKNVDPSQLQYVPSPRSWLRDHRWEDNDLFQDQFVSTREWFMEKYRTADAAAVARKYGFIYSRPPMPADVTDVDQWCVDQRKVWIGRVARHVLYSEPLTDE